jgi:hypothetical protein
VAVVIFLALIGGAIYFSVISIKDSHRRDEWSLEAFEIEQE